MKNLSLLIIAFLLLHFTSFAQAPNIEWVKTFNNSRDNSEDYSIQQTFDSVTDSNTTLIGRWANGPCLAVDVSGNIAYFGNGGYLEVVDISDPANPIELGKVLSTSVVYGVAVSGSYAYVANGAGGLRIIDVSTPSGPVEVGFFDTGDDASGVAVSGSYAYVADYDDLRIIDVSTPSSPVEVGFYDTGGYARGVAVSGNYVYVADETGLCIIDVSTPSSPVEVAFYETDGYAYGVAISSSYAYVADVYDGLRIIDVSTHSNPIEVGFYDTGSNAWIVAVSGNVVYVADVYDGLYIIRNDMAVFVEDHNRLIIPVEFALDQNYPNPFNPSTNIKYSVPQSSDVVIKVFDILGNEIETLLNEEKSIGTYEITWTAENLVSGIYFYRLQAVPTGRQAGSPSTGSGQVFVETKKMILLR
jgi:hypothetical protein